MNTLTVVALSALVSVVVVPFLLRALLRLWLGRVVGEAALAKQPDRIQLMPATPGVWRDRERSERLAADFAREGFRDAGTFTVAEMPGVVLRLLAHAGDALVAVVYEHPKAGSWVECVCRYQDGTSAQFTTLPATGLEGRPGCVRVNAPGLDPSALLARMRAERPARALRPVSASTVAADFEQAYADEIAWRRQRGISGREVAAVAERMKQSA